MVLAASFLSYGAFGAYGLFMIGALVVVHEFGHFLAAKLFNIGVPVFSVGMGPRLFGFNWRGTDYRVSSFPVGGYVQMAGADPFGERDFDAHYDPETDFMQKPVWQRLIVMLAGPVFNLVLPFIVFTAVLMAGEPQAASVVGLVLEDSPAEQAGFRAGDRIVAANGEPVEVFSDVYAKLRDAPDAPLNLGVERAGQRIDLILPGGVAGYTFDGFVDMESVGMLSSSRSSRIGVDDPASPAGQAGLQVGDVIEAVDGTPTRTLEDVLNGLSDAGPHTVQVLRVDREGTRQSLQLTLAPSDWSPPTDDVWANRWGIVPIMMYVGRVSVGSAAEQAELAPLDRLWSIDGAPVHSWSDLRRLVGASMEGRTEEQGPRSIDLVVLRSGEKVAMTLTPRITRELVRADVRFRPIMGVEQHPDAYVSGPSAKKYYAFTEAVPLAGRQGWQILKMIFGTLGNLVTGDIKPQEAVGGPVEIFRAAGESAKAGIHTYARTLGSISFSLGIVNLLPFPVFDGGQIVFYLIEGLRGRPVSARLRERIQIVGVLSLMALFLLVTVMDVNRWLGWFQ